MFKVKSIYATVSLLVGITYLAAPRQVAADVVHADHVIIQGNACIGSSDCVDERFFIGDVDIVDSAPDILFEDTSSGADDWRILVNSGVFSIMKRPDGGGETTMFTISEGAPANSIHVNSAGEVGFGTSTPFRSLNIVATFPIIRLESDFAMSVWEIGPSFCTTPGVGCNLAIGRPGATPFELDPQSPDNSLVIDQVGAVGLGTESPAAALHVKRSDGTAKLLVEEMSGALASRTVLELRNNGNPRIDLVDSNSGVTWRYESVGGGGSFRFFRVGSPIALGVGAAGNVTVAGTMTTGGPQCGGGCDFVFDPNYELESIEQHAASMWENSHLPAVGPTEPSQSMNLTEKVGGLINELEKAHIYIERVNERLGEEQARNDELAKRLTRLEAMLAPQTADD